MDEKQQELNTSDLSNDNSKKVSQYQIPNIFQYRASMRLSEAFCVLCGKTLEPNRETYCSARCCRIVNNHKNRVKNGIELSRKLYKRMTPWEQEFVDTDKVFTLYDWVHKRPVCLSDPDVARVWEEMKNEKL